MRLALSVREGNVGHVRRFARIRIYNSRKNHHGHISQTYILQFLGIERNGLKFVDSASSEFRGKRKNGYGVESRRLRCVLARISLVEWKVCVRRDFDPRAYREKLVYANHHALEMDAERGLIE